MTALLLALALTAQPPPPAAAMTPPPLTQKEQFDRLTARRRAAAQAKARARTVKAQREYQTAEAQRRYEVKMAPIWAQQATTQAKLNIQQQQANAFSSLANAAQKEAAIDASRLSVEARQAGYPQVGLMQSVPRPGGFYP